MPVKPRDAAKRVTAIFLASLKCGRDNGEIRIDAGTRGHGAPVLRITNTNKHFYYRYFCNGQRHFELLGHFNPKGAFSWHTEGRCNKGGLLTLAAAKEGFYELAQLIVREYLPGSHWSSAVGTIAF